MDCLTFKKAVGRNSRLAGDFLCALSPFGCAWDKTNGCGAIFRGVSTRRSRGISFVGAECREIPMRNVAMPLREPLRETELPTHKLRVEI